MSQKNMKKLKNWSIEEAFAKKDREFLQASGSQEAYDRMLKRLIDGRTAALLCQIIFFIITLLICIFGMLDKSDQQEDFILCFLIFIVLVTIVSFCGMWLDLQIKLLKYMRFQNDRKTEDREMA